MTAVVAIACIVSCADTPEAPVTAEPVAPAAHTLSFEEGHLGFDGRTIDFPAAAESLAELLGPPSRSLDKANIIDVWDDLGLRSYRAAGSGQVTEVDVDLRPGPFGFSPRSCFRGEITVPGGRFRECSTAAELRAAGFRQQSEMPAFSWRLRLGRFCVIADGDDGVSSLCFAWRGPDTHVPGPPLAAGELFCANSRDYDFPFDEMLREVERRGNVSVFQLEIHGHGGVVGRCFFEMGALGELGRRRGYEYMVMLTPDSTIEGDESDDARTVSMVVGFLHDQDADLAREFPDDLHAGQVLAVTPTDFILDVLPGWPDGGKRVAER